jgi:hypothetical protein
LVERLNGIEEVTGSNPVGSKFLELMDLQFKATLVATASYNNSVDVTGVETTTKRNCCRCHWRKQKKKAKETLIKQHFVHSKPLGDALLVGIALDRKDEEPTRAAAHNVSPFMKIGSPMWVRAPLPGNLHS